ERDGDIISLFYNGELILERFTLQKKPKAIIINVPENGKPSYLIMKAHNLGRVPPNTARLTIHDGKKIHEVRLTSSLQVFGGIEFRYNAKLDY
ncbi:MAG: hypothetical protein NZ108_00820, partial [Bacteroidia bacterium]|nr:hypothetical protein [Bacteroidia bacterium]